MDVEALAVSVPVTSSSIDEATPAQATSRLAATSERRMLITLGSGTFVATLVFVIPPLFFHRWRATCR